MAGPSDAAQEEGAEERVVPGEGVVAGDAGEDSAFAGFLCPNERRDWPSIFAEASTWTSFGLPISGQ